MEAKKIIRRKQDGMNNELQEKDSSKHPQNKAQYSSIAAAAMIVFFF